MATIEYTNLELSYGGSGLTNVSCSATPCGTIEKGDLTLPAGSIVGDEYSLHVHSLDCCANNCVGCTADCSPYYAISTACCASALPMAFALNVSGDCSNMNGYYDMFSGTFCGITPCWIGQHDGADWSSNVLVFCNSGVLTARFRCNNHLTCDDTSFDITLSVSSCCPFAATGSGSLPVGLCGSCSGSISVSCSAPTGAGTGGGGTGDYLVYFRDIQIPAKYFFASSPFCATDPTNCCDTNYVTIDCYSGCSGYSPPFRLPYTLFATFRLISGSDNEYDGKSCELHYHPLCSQWYGLLPFQAFLTRTSYAPFGSCDLTSTYTESQFEDGSGNIPNYLVCFQMLSCIPTLRVGDVSQLISAGLGGGIQWNEVQCVFEDNSGCPLSLNPFLSKLTPIGNFFIGSSDYDVFISV